MTLFPPQRRRPIVFFLLLCLGGFLGNWFKLPLFFNVDFLFGSCFVMLAIVRFGLPGGVLAGVVAASCTYLLWNHPWAIVIFSAEALCVALCNRRKPGQLILFDVLFWLCLGMPLVWVFYHAVMGLPLQATVLVALKQSINGIFNAMLATLLYTGYRYIKAERGEGEVLVSLQDILFTAFMTATLLPTFFYLVIDVRQIMADDDRDICRRVRSVGKGAHDLLESWLTTNHQTVIALVRLTGDPNRTAAAELQRQVDALHLANPNLWRLGVADRHDRTVAFSPLIDELGESTLGRDLSDRSFVAAMRQTLKPLVSDVVRGKIGQPGPRLALVVPYVVDGQYRGHAIGSADFAKLAAQMQILVENRYSDITILDREGIVVVSTSQRQTPLQPFARPAGGERRILTDDIYHWLPPAGRNVSIMKRWQDSLVVQEAQLSDETPWTIVVESSPVPYLTVLNQHTIDNLILLWGILLLTLIVSRLLSVGIVAALERLEEETSVLPQLLAAGGTGNWPQSRIRELRSLSVNFQGMAAALRSSFQELRTLNLTLEERVAERSLALKESEEQYRRIVSTANEGIWIANQELITTYVNPRLAEMFGYRSEEMVGRPIKSFIMVDHLTDYDDRMVRRRQGSSEQFERRMRRKDGREIWLLMSAAPLLDAENRFIGTFAMCTDITARKEMEQALIKKQVELEELNQSLEMWLQQNISELRKKDQVMILQSRQAAMGEMINNIAHQWRQPLNSLALILADIKDAHDFNALDRDYLEQATATGNRLVQQMSATINDFRNFFRPDKEAVTFSARRQIAEVLSLVEASFASSNIAIRFDPTDDVTLYGYPNEYSQVLLNLLSNAREAIMDSGMAAGAIDIRLFACDGCGCVTVRDNGGGIPDTIIEKIFEPYFSSKPLGTGIGLYMSQMIIERNMHGRIEVKNVDGGAEFTVVTPLAGEER